MRDPLFNVYFENWQFTLNFFLNKSMMYRDEVFQPEGVIKIYAMRDDPRIVFEKPKLRVIPIPGSPLKGSYDFGESGVFTGQQIDEELIRRMGNADREALGVARALMRFSYAIGSARDGSFLYIDGERALNHPVDDLDAESLSKVSGNPGRLERLHVDIFIDETYKRLSTVLGLKQEEIGDGRCGSSIRLRRETERLWGLRGVEKE